MKILLLHPGDMADGGAWSRERWDLVVDLGFAGREAYAGWSRILNSRVLSIHHFVRHTESYRWVNEIFERGRGKLLDRIGLDWWEILAMESYQDLHMMYLLRQLRHEVCARCFELMASRPHRSSRLAGQVFGVPVRYFASAEEGSIPRAKRALRSARNLRLAQIAEIALDKWDSGFQFRRHFAARVRASAPEPCILLPSAYSNVTRSVLAYASRLPDRRFLLITTRRNAIPESAPANVIVGTLAPYVRSERTTCNEAKSLQEEWRPLSDRWQSEDEPFSCAAKAGVWDYFPAHLRQGVLLREAWSGVLQSERVKGVLCGDDLNYHTRLPLLLAQRLGLNAIYCSHGALDCGFLFKKPYADMFLVKGEMEQDYLECSAQIEPEKIVVGAPVKVGPIPSDSTRDAIVFFSQPYEVIGGRADSIYRELIPRLHAVARASGRRLFIKLHPFESMRARRALVDLALGNTSHDACEMIGGGSPEKVIARAWCGVTVDSSVAVECAVNNVPFFLCGWLDFTGNGYVEQFARFEVAQVLHSPEDIQQIPQMVSTFRPDPAKLRRIWCEANPHHLDEVLFGTRQARLNTCAC